MNLQPPPAIAIVQARMGSSRLPGKVLRELGGRPMLGWVVERTRRAACLAETVVATTTDPADDAVADFCRAQGYPFYRGSLHDVLDRYYGAAREFQAGTVVRITADCPLMDPALIDETVRSLSLPVPLDLPSSTFNLPPSTSSLPPSTFHFSCNRLPPPWGRSYPIGLDIEVCTFAALERAWREARQPYHREHVMPYLYEEGRAIHFTRQGGIIRPAARRQVPLEGLEVADPFFVLLNHSEGDYGALRWTVDTPEDLAFVQAVLARFPGRDDFTWQEVLALVRREPELAEINAAIRHKNYQDVDTRREQKS